MTRMSTRAQHFTELALAQLREAQRTRQHYDDLLQAAIKAHGDVVGTPTSGCYNPALPGLIKDELRTLAHNIGVQVRQAREFWRRARRKRATFQRYAEDARKLADGRISYY